MSNVKIKKTGDLRKFLVEAMEKLESGNISVDIGSGLAKLGREVNNSFYAEIEAMRIKKELGQTAEKMGQLPVSYD
jgi:hypothetical protein